MRLFHSGNHLSFFKHPRILQTHSEGFRSLTLTTTIGSRRYYSKCKYINTCFGFVQNNASPLLKKWEITSSHLGLKTFNSTLKYSTVNEDDLSKDAIVKDILKDIKDDFEKEFKTFSVGESPSPEHSKAEICDGLGVTSTNLSEMNDDASSGIIRNSKDIPSSSSSVLEDEVLLVEEEGDDDIEDFIDYGYTAEEDEEDSDVHLYTPPIELKRGTTGVFDIEDLVTVLKDENGIDICVIDVPKSKNYVDYMVIVSGKSARHIKSMAENIRWLYKQRKHKNDPFVQIEGLGTNNWFAMDLGNIALHIFLPQLREKYDLETLWTIGDVGDDETSLELDDPYAMKELPSEETNETVISEKEAKNTSTEDNNDNLIQNLSNKN